MCLCHKTILFLRERDFCIHLIWAFWAPEFAVWLESCFFSLWRGLGMTQARARWLRPPLAACLLGLACCVAAVYTCWSAFCVWVGAASLHARAPGCSWCVSQDSETYELAAGKWECLFQFLGELHVFSKRLDHCPQSRLARQNVTVTVWDTLNV
jgi:hypothetical protein